MRKCKWYDSSACINMHAVLSHDREVVRIVCMPHPIHCLLFLYIDYRPTVEVTNKCFVSFSVSIGAEVGYNLLIVG